jgi:LysM repeat protein
VIVHDVEPGDTLLGIAGRYGVELDELLVANGLESESILAIGQPIVITTVSPTPTLVPASPTIKPALEPTLKPGALDERPAAAALPENVPAVVFPAPTAPPSLTSVPTPAPTA